MDKKLLISIFIGFIILAMQAIQMIQKEKELRREEEERKAYFNCLLGCLSFYNQCESKAPEGFNPEFRVCLDNQEKCKLECKEIYQEKLPN